MTLEYLYPTVKVIKVSPTPQPHHHPPSGLSKRDKIIVIFGSNLHFCLIYHPLTIDVHLKYLNGRAPNGIDQPSDAYVLCVHCFDSRGRMYNIQDMFPAPSQLDFPALILAIMHSTEDTHTYVYIGNLLLSAFHKGLTNYTKDLLIREKADELVKKLITIASTSPLSPVNVFELCGLFSLEVVCKSGFASDLSKGLLESDAKKLMDAIDGGSLTFIFDTVLLFLREAGLGLRLPVFIGDCYRKHQYWAIISREEMVDSFLQNSTKNDAYLLTPLARGVDSYLGRKLSHEEIVEEAMGLMFWDDIYNAYLSDRKLRNEVGNVFVNAVIKKTFRLYPAILSTLPRILKEPLPVGGYALPGGTVVGMQNYVHHRSPLVFPDSDGFKPERWLEASQAMEAFFTRFSVGQKSCIRQNLMD
ncbi:cytochrome P450 [Bisporella sp. PMI_857]|nr:cytochrome P450 [Bisporella sp. PMI_857]